MTQQAKEQQAIKASWWQTFRQQGYYFKWLAIGVIVTGIFLHATSIVIGRDLFHEKIFTPLFDAIFAVPMTYAGVAGWLVWKRVVHPSWLHKIFYTLVIVYFTVSIIVHLRTLITWDTSYILSFPDWYGVALLPFLCLILAFLWRLQLKGVDR